MLVLKEYIQAEQSMFNSLPLLRIDRYCCIGLEYI